MAKSATLRLIIDAKPAKVGAAQFKTAATGVKSSAAGAAKGVAALAAAMAAIGVATKSVRTLIEFERGLVGVGKTTGASGNALKALGNEIVALSTRIPVATGELLAIGQAAGQMGVTGSENILKFTETIAKLGTASDLSGEEAATALARILNVTGEATGTVDVLADVIVGLGNSFAASESEIAHTATQVAAATKVFGVSSAEAAALGATLKALGQRAELSGSAIGRTFRAIDKAVRSGGDSLATLESIAGPGIAETFQANSVRGLEQFLLGLQKIIETGGDSTAALESIGLRGEELLKVIPTLATNADQLGRALEEMNDQLAGGEALNKEAAAAFDTLGAELDRLGNTVTAVVLEFKDITGPLADFVGTVADATAVAFGLNVEMERLNLNTLALANLIKFANPLTSTLAGNYRLATEESVKYNNELRDMKNASLRAADAQQELSASITNFAVNQELQFLQVEIAKVNKLITSAQGGGAARVNFDQARELGELGLDLERIPFQTRNIQKGIVERFTASIDSKLIDQLIDKYIPEGTEVTALLSEKKLTELLNKLNDERAALIKQFQSGAPSVVTAGAADDLKEIERDFSRALTGPLEDAIFQAKEFEDVMISIAKNIARAFLDAALFAPLGAAFSDALAPFIPVINEAKGDAFSGGRIVPFAGGGIVGSPTLFPLAGGRVGLMGEAGPEAILPLERGRNGKLGVQSSGNEAVVAAIQEQTQMMMRGLNASGEARGRTRRQERFSR